jgi:hypothetical protein
VSHVDQQGQRGQGRRRFDHLLPRRLPPSPLGLFASELVWLRIAGKKKEVKKETKLGMAYKKDDNFGEWYSEVG